MKRTLLLLCLFGLAAGCAATLPQVTEVAPQDDRAALNGVRVPRVIPYEIFVYTADDDGRLVLKSQEHDMLPDPYSVYVVNYEGAMVSSSKFTLSVHANGGIKQVKVESTRTMQAAGDAGKSLVGDYRTEEKARADRQAAEAKALADRLGNIVTYRQNYDALRKLNVEPDEPKMLDGTTAPGKSE